MLSDILGHSSVRVTERYAHLRPDLYSARVLNALAVDLSPAAGEVVKLPAPPPAGDTGTVGYVGATRGSR